MAEAALPYINAVIEKQLRFPYSPLYLLAETGFCILLGVLAGSYPAFHLSKFRPGKALYGRLDKAKQGFNFRESLVVIQFMLSFFLITASWIVLSQNDLLQNKNLGFDKEHVVIIPLTSDQLQHQEATKQKYSNHPNVISATIGFGLPGDIVSGDQVVDPADGQVLPANLFLVDFDYISTMGMKIVAGREFSRDFPTDSSSAFVINETAVKSYGFGTPEEAIGKPLEWKQWHNGKMKKGIVIGIVKDFNFKSLREKVTASVLQIYPYSSWKMAVRVKPEGLDNTIQHFKKTYGELESRWIFTYNFLDENFDAMYKSEKRLGLLFTIFTYLAMAVACLGLFGLVEYSVNQRAKEISIRKIFGAGIVSLLVLLTQRYFLLMFVAFVLVIPVSYYIANEWLSNFEYRIDIEPMLFLKASIVVVMITCVTVSFQSIRASLANPAEVLKNE
jgi:putative ABC transport system permease protein